jgi:hypothetical protein
VKKIVFLTVVAMVLLLGLFLVAPAYAADPGTFDAASRGIKDPDPSLPDNIKAFFGSSGMWKGYVEAVTRTQANKEDAWLVVKSISEKEAIISCKLESPTGGSFAAKDAIAKLSPGQDGRIRLVITIRGKGRDTDLALRVQGKNLTGLLGNLYVYLDPVEGR